LTKDDSANICLKLYLLKNWTIPANSIHLPLFFEYSLTVKPFHSLRFRRLHIPVPISNSEIRGIESSKFNCSRTWACQITFHECRLVYIYVGFTG
jgi:hypothetical protein